MLLGQNSFELSLRTLDTILRLVVFKEPAAAVCCYFACHLHFCFFLLLPLKIIQIQSITLTNVFSRLKLNFSPKATRTSGNTLILLMKNMTERSEH